MSERHIEADIADKVEAHRARQKALALALSRPSEGLVQDAFIFNAMRDKKEEVYETAIYLASIALQQVPTDRKFVDMIPTNAWGRFWSGALAVPGRQVVARGWALRHEVGCETFVGEGYQSHKEWKPGEGMALLSTGSIGYYSVYKEQTIPVLDHEVDLKDDDIINFSHVNNPQRVIYEPDETHMRQDLSLGQDIKIFEHHVKPYTAISDIESHLIRFAAQLS